MFNTTQTPNENWSLLHRSSLDSVDSRVGSGILQGAGVVGTLGLQNQWGMPPYNVANLRIGAQLKTVTPDIPAVPQLF